MLKYKYNMITSYISLAFYISCHSPISWPSSLSTVNVPICEKDAIYATWFSWLNDRSCCVFWLSLDTTSHDKDTDIMLVAVPWWNRESILVFAWHSSAGTVVTPSSGRRGCSLAHIVANMRKRKYISDGLCCETESVVGLPAAALCS